MGPIPDAAMKRLKATAYPTIITKDPNAEASGSSGSERNSAQRERATAADPAIPKVRAGKGVISIFFNGSVLNQVTVAAVPDPATGALAISATGPRDSAPNIANVFADELLKSLAARVQARFDRPVTRTTRTRDQVEGQIAGIDTEIAFTPDPTVRGQLLQRRTSLQSRKDQLDQDLGLLALSGPDPRSAQDAGGRDDCRREHHQVGGRYRARSQQPHAGRRPAIGLFMALGAARDHRTSRCSHP